MLHSSRFFCGRKLELDSFLAIAKMFWLTLWKGEDARKCTPLYAVTWQLFSWIYCHLKIFGFLFMRNDESSKARKSKELCATNRWMSGLCLVKLKYVHPSRNTRMSLHKIGMGWYSDTITVFYFALSIGRDRNEKLVVNSISKNWICAVVDTASLKIWKQELPWKI